jgi:hypothetical protein
MTSSKTTKNVTPVRSIKMSPAGCFGMFLGVILFIVLVFVIMAALFTWSFNIVAPIFGGPTIDFAQGAVMWFLIVLVGSVFRRAV